ncbi:hypothetical protein HELRODRAFT_161542 [Helobdella robusta]|uniref:Aminotransferase class I/classII large domain-containing protein n=1 Tax=Helobdella robusta TaxID=6412 RepID=T1ERL7_HELRO|nr:hypothetical protein HELRODRAFT_161542 [Helobdella robusta]ESO02290.1 hypothetical protein HELRODRAFT_161542 [Helobdella robusta]
MQKHLHRPPLSKTNELDLCITSGSLDGLTKSFEMLVSAGDQVLIEQPLCSHVISALKPLECTIVPLETDSHGITPSSLAQISKCGNNNNSMKFLYTSPNGSIPAGITTTLERKEMVYKFAQENDLLILENDPYSFLQYTKEPEPSYLSMDVDGRVLRFDSLSAVISPGLQIGYVTGAKALIERIVLHVMVSSMHVSTLSQVMTLELLKELGYDGFKDYTNSVAEFFKDKLKVVLRAADKYLKDSIEWTVPQGGVCLWMKLKNGYQYVGEFEETTGSSHIIFASGKHFFVDPPNHATDYIVAFFYYCFEDSDDSIDYKHVWVCCMDISVISETAKWFFQKYLFIVNSLKRLISSTHDATNNLNTACMFVALVPKILNSIA